MCTQVSITQKLYLKNNYQNIRRIAKTQCLKPKSRQKEYTSVFSKSKVKSIVIVSKAVFDSL